MRLWSLHPRYLDRAGLVALWREALLGQAVLRGATAGYRRHPQLIRFRSHPDPEAAIARYLEEIHREARERGYCFDRGKIGPCRAVQPLAVTQGQLRYEQEHLLRKLLLRAPRQVALVAAAGEPAPHPLFTVVPGGIEAWERVRPR